MTTQKHPGKALVLMSGGQDSTVALCWARQHFSDALAFSINYGQRHGVELERAAKICTLLRVKHFSVNVPSVLRSQSPLIAGDVTVPTYTKASDLATGVDPTFVPTRNLLFLTLAINRAIIWECDHIVIGACLEDYEGYPDCRKEFFEAVQLLTKACHPEGKTITIQTPLLELSKKQTVDLALGLPLCMTALAHSHTCYEGKVPPCGKCHACILRARGFRDAGVSDPLISRLIEKGELPKDYNPFGLIVEE